jgi:PAS domain S-box-containing protein
MHSQPEQENRLNTEGSDQLANTLVVNCGRALAQAVNEQDLLRSVCNTLVNNCGFRLAWFGYTEPDTSNSIRLVAQAGDLDGFLNETGCSETPATLAIQAGESCCIKAIADSPLVVPIRAAALKRGYTSVLSLPLKSDGTLFGALTIYADDSGKLDEPIVERLQEWSDLFALRVKTLRLHEGRDLNNDLQNIAAPQRLENQLRLIIDTTPALIHTSRPDGYLDYFNKRWVEYLGVSLDDVEGWKWTASVHPDDVPGILEKWRACLASGEVFEYETRVRRADGEYRRMLHRKVPLRDRDGNIVKWYGSSIDIEEMKQAEEELRRSETYLGEAQRLTHTGSWALKPIPEEFFHVSDELLRIYGFDPQEHVPTLEEIRNRIHPEDRDRVRQNREKQFREKGEFVEDYRIVLPDGAVRHVHIIGHPILAESGDLVEYVGTAMDVTERKRAEEQLRRSAEELQRSESYLADGQRLAHAGSWAFGPDGFDYWSPELFRIHGLDPAGKPPTVQEYLDLIHPQDREFMANLIKRILVEPARFDATKRIVRPNGEVRYIRCVGAPVLDSTLKKFVGSAIDVTEHELLTKELRRKEAHLAEAQRLSQTGSFGWSISSGEIFWSEETFRIFEYDRATCKPTADLVLQRVHPEDIPLVQRTIDHASRGNDFDVEHRLLMPDGSVKHVHVMALTARDELGNVECIGAVRDITMRKRAEQRLVVQHTVTQLLAEAATLEEATPKILQAVCECLVWDLGALWRIDRAAGVLRCVELWHKESVEVPDFEAITRESTFLPGIGLPGRVWASREPAYIPDVVQDSNFLRTSIAAREGLHAAFAFPILLGSEVVGVMDFFSKEIRQPDQRLLDMMATIGSQIGQFIERKRAEEEIRRNEAELSLIIDTIPQLIAALSPNGEVLYVNKSVLEYSGLSVEDGKTEDSRRRFIHPDDLGRLREERQRGLEAGQPFELEMRLLGKDERYRWFLTHYKPLRDQHAQIVRWYATSTDIEDRKRVEEGIRKENIALREEIDKASMFEEIVGSSAALRKVLLQVAKVAPTESTVLITGETGTGKELVARAIHKRSTRSARAFVSVNCAAIPQSLIASELFGHEKGAFTGALQRRLGRFELAERGTIFLDEIGDLPSDTQNTLLRVLQEREFERVGGTQSIRSDVRVIAATNRNLGAAIAAGTFRSDLFYRLNVFPIELPSLRERREDIPMLVEYFIDRYASKLGKKIRSTTKPSLKVLRSYSWPGNIRELQNVIERAVIVCETETLVIDENWLSRESVKVQPLSRSLSEELSAREKERIEAALFETKGRVSGPSGAAAKLGIPRSTLDSKIRSLKISTHRFKTF